jgi:hypothetical protein
MAYQNKGLDLVISKVMRIFHFSHNNVPLSPKTHCYMDIDFVIEEFSFFMLWLYSSGQDDDFDVPYVGVPSEFYFTTQIPHCFSKLSHLNIWHIKTKVST